MFNVAAAVTNISTPDLLVRLLGEVQATDAEQPQAELGDRSTEVLNRLRTIADSRANRDEPGYEIVIPFGWTDQYVSFRGVVWNATVMFVAVFALAHTGGLSWIALAPIMLDAADKLRHDFTILQPGEVVFYDAVLSASRERVSARSVADRKDRFDACFVSEEDVRHALQRNGMQDQVGLDQILEGLARQKPPILEKKVIDGQPRYAVRV